jgi:hypothetical protein
MSGMDDDEEEIKALRKFVIEGLDFVMDGEDDAFFVFAIGRGSARRVVSWGLSEEQIIEEMAFYFKSMKEASSTNRTLN